MIFAPNQPKPEKSKGHIQWFGDFELFESDGKVYKAHKSNPIDVNTNYRWNNQYECTLTHFLTLQGDKE